ncbi:MAG: hypothetical protein HKN21_12840 [Candidatus Eisenbacteria bacterium]|uniref:Uncharacterized protein n=1 Tax=Eiseniibacteriota bacterium TaxID=2212470 RepID=A0A7Y2H328_UNCEI|nr:hypothetical protein [Candidatus Eisenbacteria bacterium]
MHWIWWVVGAVVLLGVAAFAYGIYLVRRSLQQAVHESHKVTRDQFPELVNEGILVYRDKLNIDIDLDDPEASAKAISDGFDRFDELKAAFATEDFWWRFVLPTGALIAEFFCLHGNGELEQEEDGEWAIKIPFADGEDGATTFPFAKSIKQATEGDPGDVYAYLICSLKLEETLKAAGH